jgi:hypothetical protein
VGKPDSYSNTPAQTPFHSPLLRPATAPRFPQPSPLPLAPRGSGNPEKHGHSRCIINFKIAKHDRDCNARSSSPTFGGVRCCAPRMVALHVLTSRDFERVVWFVSLHVLVEGFCCRGVRGPESGLQSYPCPHGSFRISVCAASSHCAPHTMWTGCKPGGGECTVYCMHSGVYCEAILVICPRGLQGTTTRNLHHVNAVFN